MLAIAIDIGGTYIKGAVIKDKVEIIDYVKVATPDNVSTLIVDSVRDIILKFRAQYHLQDVKVGISSAGVIDEATCEVILTGPTIQNFNGTNFKSHLDDICSELCVYNDVNAALRGELMLHPYNEDNIFCLTLGTGIGGAFYNHATGIYTGSQSRANEIGYLLYRSEDDTTYEMRASTSALKDLMIEKDFEYETNVLKLFERAQAGDVKANDILNTWSKYVAEGIAQIQIIYDPSLILIGGGISSQGEHLLKYIRPKVHHYLPQDYDIAPLKTTRSKNDAALFGAISNLSE
ncbi:ROK family protein [Staphylococcus massiliensis]|uniref:ROK family protein n=1 Tax=Staphylococcus massiliensis TaxID=555791 RepID=UPI001EDCF04B|nr:ROK family protein [Staphylococcus massiliensis]MCG3402129.1 ROK family protein [Staphylococcus massiliensis]